MLCKDATDYWTEAANGSTLERLHALVNRNAVAAYSPTLPPRLRWLLESKNAYYRKAVASAYELSARRKTNGRNRVAVKGTRCYFPPWLSGENAPEDSRIFNPQ